MTSWDFGSLAFPKTAAEHLNLAPQQHTELIFRQILVAVTPLSRGLVLYATSMATPTARARRRYAPNARHAALAVNLAGTVATFLVSTLERGAKEMTTVYRPSSP